MTTTTATTTTTGITIRYNRHRKDYIKSHQPFQHKMDNIWVLYTCTLLRYRHINGQVFFKTHFEKYHRCNCFPAPMCRWRCQYWYSTSTLVCGERRRKVVGHETVGTTFFIKASRHCVRPQPRTGQKRIWVLYGGLIHAGSSRTAWDIAVAKFSKGEEVGTHLHRPSSPWVDFKAVNMVTNYDLPTCDITYVHRIELWGRVRSTG